MTKFRFEAFWPQMPGFLDCIQDSWNKPVPPNQNTYGKLHIKLSRVAKALKKWSNSLVPQGKLEAAICKEVISQLEKALESRQLSSKEVGLIKLLRARVWCLSTIQKSRERQRSRIT
jgi:hypothetical protein